MWAVKKAVPSWIRADVKMAGETALHWAAKRGHEDTVKVLLRFRADPLAVDDADTTPGKIAFGHLAVAFSANVSSLLCGGDTEHWARRSDLKELINPPPPPPEPGTKKKVKGSKQARAQVTLSPKALVCLVWHANSSLVAWGKSASLCANI